MKYKLRKHIWKVALALLILLLPFVTFVLPAFAETEGPLLEPIVPGQSLEICLNSRGSQHSLTGSATDQQLSNILWAAGRPPLIGTYRDIYVATQSAKYLYDPDNHSLSTNSSAVTDQGAFQISFDRELAFDAGLSYMPALLASVSLWDSTESPVANCPKEAYIYFGVQAVGGLNTTLVATCSLLESDPGWLPDPSTDGSNNLEALLTNLNYTDSFTQTNLTLQQISQILWAGYGCTPHTAYNGNKGLTVPSGLAAYFLTGTIYLANEEGVYRYQNRNPSDNLTTQDHRLEQIYSDDVRSDLESDVDGLPDAPLHIIICLDYTYINEIADQYSSDNTAIENYALLETGFAASNMLLQSTALDLGAHFKTELTASEKTDVRTTANITSIHKPQVIVSIGPVAQPRALASYSDAAHTEVCEEFKVPVTESTVYMYGTNLLANHDYRIAYYDNSNTRRATEVKTSGASGNLSSQHTFVQGTDEAGDWNVIICDAYLTPSISYNGSWAFIITSDTFHVDQAAIPEFPTVIAAIVAFVLCVGGYLWMRRRKTVPVLVKKSRL